MIFQLQIYEEEKTINAFGRKITIKGVEGFVAGNLIRVADTEEEIFHYEGYARYPGTNDSICYSGFPFYRHKENFFKTYKEILYTLCDQFPDIRFEYCGIIKGVEKEEIETSMLPDFMKVLKEVAKTYNKTLEIKDEDYKFNAASLY